jgi:acyl carrier protein
MTRRVMVTGLGLITSLGQEVEAFWRRPLAGESGISRVESDRPPGVSGQGEARTFERTNQGGRALATIEERVIEIVVEQLCVDKSKTKVTRESSFVNDLGAISLDTQELVMDFEEEFNINIPEEDAEKIKTVGEAIDCVKAHL